jgi:hypothetical protein
MKDFGPVNGLAGLISVLSKGRATAVGNRHGPTAGESK